MKLFTNFHNLLLKPKDDFNNKRFGMCHLIVDDGKFIALDGKSMVIVPIDEFPIIGKEHLEGKAIHYDVVKQMSKPCWSSIELTEDSIKLNHTNKHKSEIHQYSGIRFEGTIEEYMELEGWDEPFKSEHVLKGQNVEMDIVERLKRHKGLIFLGQNSKQFIFPNYKIVIPEYKNDQSYNYCAINPYVLTNILECFTSSLDKNNVPKVEMQFADDPNHNHFNKSPKRAIRVLTFECSGVGYLMPSLVF